MDKLKISYRSPGDLKPRQANPRTHSKKQIRQIAESIRRFDFVNPVLVDRCGGIVAGHGRAEAAKRLGLETIPTICLQDLSEDEVRAYVIADNRLAELAGWDQEILATELQGLVELDIDFDVTLTGFEIPEIDILIGQLDAVDSEEDPDDEAVEVPPGVLPSRGWGTRGASASTASYAAMPQIPTSMSDCWKGSWPKWCSRTRPTTC